MSPATCVELFAGAGGAALGLRDAGFESVLAVEHDSDACATLRSAGFKHVFEGDVREAPLTGLGLVNLLWASPPCQAFSTSGKRLGAADERDGWPMTLHTIDSLTAEGSRPEWVLCENVVGLLQHVRGCLGTGVPEACAGCYWERFILRGFQERYAHVAWQVLNTADYGVPQARQRVFLAAGPRPFPWPAPTHNLDNLLWDKWVGGSYWGRHGMVRPMSGPAMRDAAQVSLRVSLSLSMPEPDKLPYVTIRDALGLPYPIRHQSPTAWAVQHLPDEVAPTVSGRGTLYAERDVQEVGRFNPHYHGSSTLALRGVGLDLFCEEEVGTASPGIDATVEAKGRRRLTDAECAILQGFPPTWTCAGPSTSRYRQVGNAVPPPVARALGSAILSR